MLVTYGLCWNSMPPRRILERNREEEPRREDREERRPEGDLPPPPPPPPDMSAQMLAGMAQFFAQFAGNNAVVTRTTGPEAVYERFM